MILVTGATGRIGHVVIRELLERALPVRALARPRARSPLSGETGVEWVDGEIGDDTSVARAMDGVHTVVLHSVPSPEQVALQERVVDAASRSGVARIVKLSVLGASPDAAGDLARWHGRVEQKLAESGIEASNVRVTRTMQDILQQVPLLLTSGLLAGCQGDGQVADVDLRDIGAVLAALAASSEPLEPVVQVTGPEAMSYASMASALARQLDRPVRYVDCTPADLLQCAQAAGIDAWQAHDLVTWQTEARDGRYAIVYDSINRITGRMPRRFESFAHEVATSLRYSNAPERSVTALGGVAG